MGKSLILVQKLKKKNNVLNVIKQIQLLWLNIGWKVDNRKSFFRVKIVTP